MAAEAGTSLKQTTRNFEDPKCKVIIGQYQALLS